MRIGKQMTSLTVFSLLAFAAGANAQPNRPVPGQVGAATGCRGRPGGLTCPSSDDVCFNTEQVVMMGYPGDPWTVDITQCIKDSAVSFITWSEVDANGDCTACDGNKVAEVEPGALIFEGLEIPADSCTGTPLCVYVHDGAFERGPGNSRPPEGVPDSCVPAELQLPSQNSSQGGPARPQLCSTCSFIVTPRRTSGACDNGVFCDGEDVCNEASTCVPAAPNADPCPVMVGGDPCAGQECDETAGGCISVSSPAGTVCGAGAFCDGPLMCNDSGECTMLDPTFDRCAGDPLDFADEGCGIKVCNPAGTSCDDVAINQQGPCDDGNACTINDACNNGMCNFEGTFGKVMCDDSILTADPGCSRAQCNPATGICEEILVNGSCDDEDPCTAGDTCVDGKCNGTQLTTMACMP